MLASKAEADKVMEQAKQAGATITDPAHDTFGADTPVTSKTPMDTYGKSFGIRTGI